MRPSVADVSRHFGRPSSVMELHEIIETDRSEEFLGEDRRVIDNSRCSTSLTRHMSFRIAAERWDKALNSFP